MWGALESHPGRQAYGFFNHSHDHTPGGKTDQGISVYQRRVDSTVSADGGTTTDLSGLVATVQKAIDPRYNVFTNTESVYVHSYGWIESVMDVELARL